MYMAYFSVMTDCIRVLDLTIDLRVKKVFRGDLPISLRSHEYDLLRFLILHRERVFTRSELLEEVWGITNTALQPARAIDVYIASLRRKIDFKKPLFIQTIHGAGYALDPEPGS